MKDAIIGGTGVYDPGLLQDAREQRVATPYGEVTLWSGTYEGREMVFLPRHGTGHTIPPHRINYRANIWALKSVGVQRVLATGAVGSLNPEYLPGHFVVVDQFLDWTKGRSSTFFGGGEQGVVHIDVTDPYCLALRRTLQEVGADLGVTIHPKGVYLCTEGPRFETAAEIRAFRMLGADLVGMTGVPEVVLAREAGLCYATIAIVTNLAAGISETPLTQEEVVEIMEQSTEQVRALLLQTLLRVPAETGCNCSVVPRPLPAWNAGTDRTDS